MAFAVYLAAAFERQDQMKWWRDRLVENGFLCTSRWLEEESSFAIANDPARCARIDLEDISRSDMVVVFAPKADTGLGSGGRHVEFGWALNRGMRIVIIGEPQNVFHYLVRSANEDQLLRAISSGESILLKNVGLIQEASHA